MVISTPSVGYLHQNGHVETTKFFYMPELQGGGHVPQCLIAGDANALESRETTELHKVATVIKEERPEIESTVLRSQLKHPDHNTDMSH